MSEITSVQNPTIKRIKALKDKKARTQQQQMLVEGEKLMLEAAQAGLVPEDVLIESSQAAKFASLAKEMEKYGARVYSAPRHVLEAACDTKTPQGACGAFSLPAPFELKGAPERLVVLDGVQDPGNVGTIWRTADAAGLSGMLLAASGADPFSPKVQRAAMGSGFRVPVRVTEHLAQELEQLRKQGYRVIVSALDGAPFYEGVPKNCERFALVIGNEARGVSDAVSSVADVRLKLPMRGGAESLNAAVAAGIMMYELTR